MMKYKFILLFVLNSCCLALQANDLTKSTIVYNPSDHPLARQMAKVLSEDIERVSGIKPTVSTSKGKGQNIILATANKTSRHKELRKKWERYAIDTDRQNIYITGSDARGLAYGVFHISEQIGVNPWYWFADIPVDKNNPKVYDYQETYVSKSPTIKYRGIFINDEDWGLKTWAERNFEKELGDIGPKTYDRVCELILRLKGNMLAPAMHTCTGAFYSHPESQVMADKWSIMITTSHCEPLLFNNASPWEWDKNRDGEWNYETNKERILKKLDDRIRETAQYDNIYTMGMRGLHDEAMKGSTDPTDRARTLEKVFDEQRKILEKYKGKKANQLKQIFVPYKETLDIYDSGLRVPDDITIVWPDDNYGYMKRVSNAAEQKRSGGSGVYYHLSYLGTPHDNLWIATTAPQLMYEELLKAYTAGANRYWLLNVGDIKLMEIETQMFFDMAYDFTAFSYDNANKWQAQWLARTFGKEHQGTFQYILDNYYRLAWDRKPEFMGYEMEWDTPEYSRLHDSDFSFETGSAQKRLQQYQDICFAYDAIENSVDKNLRPSLFEMLGYSTHSAFQMNRRFLYAQANHETGNTMYAMQSRDANTRLQGLIDRYHSLFDGKWDQIISEIPPGFTALYQNMPELVDEPTDAYRLPDSQRHPELAHKLDFTTIELPSPFRILEGIGTDWKALQMGQPLDFEHLGSVSIPIPSSIINPGADSISVCISVVPMWPVAYDRSNKFAVSVDDCKSIVCENKFQEWGREWKIQVLENRKEFVLTFPLRKGASNHHLTLSIIDPGQIVQKITFQ
ncbi:MAG: glycosyl hydrolase 115 family protein [Prevotellaceae bacterium]|nr:glycosyl hydrolase 115 family protein [Prevotellaceae bacterium]MDY5210422.1 glycosyl hydrolase 115 family protein [Prevotella sp.]